MTASRIWLLRSSEGPSDPYEMQFSDAGYLTSSHPVLSFENVNDGHLGNALRSPDRFSGVILTSPRASARFLDSLPESRLSDWKEKPVYAVGERTARDVDVSGFLTRGEDSGTGRVLAQLIADSHSDDRPLLFLAGNRRRAELMDRLSTEAIAVAEITVYVTHSIHLEEPADPPEWIALFSPSGVEAISNWRRPLRSRIAAIGDTTAGALENAGLRVHAISDDPTPTSLLEAVLQAG